MKAVDEQVKVILSEAAKIRAEGEAEYMRIIKEAYSTPERLEFYNYVRRLDALKKTVDKDKTFILPADNELTKQLLKP